MSDWWALRTPRERVLVGTMLALLALVLAWLAIVRPLSDALDAAKARQQAAALALGEARARRAIALPPAPSGPVDSLAATTLAEAGFPGARVTSHGPGRASVTLDAARPQALFGWVAQMERRGLVVDRLRAQANPDRTLSAEIVLQAGRR
ncbi:MAG: ral secretion pathway protein [Sphingomonadales bacterium]|jgi:general secretion pathway protein M|nr:ral secretion pathway protein [Sphingomonadales bacterium]MEA3045664.1 ral secretion pathway protein [Sphingomonadales bacterium]MEA3047617.1 ral secretion pathway protein [Sphingomonadales bacterium]